jgi:2-polyprenyl-3-methyl-5-hydroxy-6-metoxy-1,4-benzoquinol methylase
MAEPGPPGDASCDISTTPTPTTTSDLDNDNDDVHGYFHSYTDLKTHEVMLADWPRNSAYRNFFERNADLVRDKVVMDVGAGTGILSLFAASVGAKRVYAVEASETAHLCKEIVAQNGLADKITVLHAR